MWVVSGQAGIQKICFLDSKICACCPLQSLGCCCPMTALQGQEDSSHISVTLPCKLNVLVLNCTSMGSLSTGIPSSASLWTSLFTSVPRTDHTALCVVWQAQRSPSVKALNLGQTLEVERSRSLPSHHLPQETFPVGLPVYSAFETWHIFLHKLRAFFFFLFARLFQVGICVGLLSAPELEWTSEELFMGRMLIT